MAVYYKICDLFILQCLQKLLFFFNYLYYGI